MSTIVHRDLVAAVRIAMKPLLRFCLRNALRIQDLLECIKLVLLQVAAEEMEAAGEEVTMSRLSAMTGIHRRDVRRIYRHDEIKDSPQGTINKILGQWLHDRRFTSRGGEPRVLSTEGSNPEFRRLVNVVSADLNPATILFELERIGLVQRVEGGVKLVTRGFLSKGDLGQAFRLMANDTADLMSAVLQNTAGESDLPNLHAKTHYDRIPADSVPEIRAWLHREGSALHQKARNYLAKFDLDINPRKDEKPTCVRVALGTFSVVESVTPKREQ